MRPWSQIQGNASLFFEILILSIFLLKANSILTYVFVEHHVKFILE